MRTEELDRLVLEAKILVVDDEVFHTRFVERFLRSLGYSNIVVVNDPRTVQELRFRTNFDLVLLDIEMPHLNGFEVMSLLTSDRRREDYVPILVFTGHTDTSFRLKALASGAKDFLTKPLEPVEAKYRIRNLLEVKVLHNVNRTERDRYQDLLVSILPRAIIYRLGNGETRIADRIENMSVLFADLVGFTAFSAEREPDEVIRMLSVIFGAFDKLVWRHGLEKVKTIGDAYMVVGGIESDDDDHAARMADLALAMMAWIKENDEARHANLRARIGLHCGPLVAGLLGGARSTYDVWGDTVNTASRYETESVPGRINLSPAFADQLDGAFELESRGNISAKGKGELAAYFLGDRRKAARYKSEYSFRFRGWPYETNE